MNYHLTGAISTFFFLLTLAGLCAQIRIVWRRKRAWKGRTGGERPTAILSLNQFTMSFLAFFSYFVYGFCLERFNHYLVWPRLVALILVLIILFEIASDRRGWTAVGTFCACLGGTLGGIALLAVRPEIDIDVRFASQMLVLVAALLLIQGYMNQVLLIRRSGQTGAVSRIMHQMFLSRDIATIAFALAMGMKAGWPLLVMNGVSGCTKVAILYHFRWARLSPKAEERRRMAENSNHAVLDHPPGTWEKAI